MEQSEVSARQYQKMTQTPIPRLVTAMAIPTTISTLITVIYNMADTYFVSQINESASAAVGVVYSIMAIIQAVGYGLAMGCSSLISRSLGRKEDRLASEYASSGFFAALAAGLLVGVLGLSVLRPMLKLIGASETMMPYAVPYARIILLAAPISCSGFVLNNLLRSEGNTALAMWSTMAGGILNMILDPLLIFTCGLGAGGAALATVISQGITWVLAFQNYAAGRTILRLRLGYVSRKWDTYSRIVTVGSPTVLRQGLGSVAAAALNVSAVVYGDAAVAAITIANKVYTLVRQSIMGLGQGFQPVAGYNFGAGRKRRAFSAFVFATVLGTGFCVTAAVLAGIFAEPIMWWFCDSAEVARLGTVALRLGSMVMPLLAFSTFVNQLYQCLGFAKVASFLASCRQGIFFLPVVLIVPRYAGVLGVQAAQPLADLLTFLVSIPFAVAFYRREVAKSPLEPN